MTSNLFNGRNPRFKRVPNEDTFFIFTENRSGGYFKSIDMTWQIHLAEPEITESATELQPEFMIQFPYFNDSKFRSYKKYTFKKLEIKKAQALLIAIIIF